MRKFLLLSAILVTMNCAGQLRSSDSTTTSTAALKRILAAAQQRNILLEQVDILNKRIVNYQQIIQNLNEKDSVTVQSYEAQIKNLNEVINLYENEIKDVGRKLKKERRKRKWTAFGGIALTGIATYFYITK